MRCVLFAWFLACVTWATVRADWPDYRGPHAMGCATLPGEKPAGYPLRWGESENVKWKTAIPHKGWSTPVVMDRKVWLTTATPDGHDFYAISIHANSGAIWFNEKLFHSDKPEPLGNQVNGYASPSPVVEPGRAYVHFGSYGTACLDSTSGKVLWQRQDLPCRHYRGPGSSPIIFRNLLILSMDGIDVQYLVALDKATGQTVWKTDRTAEWNDLRPDGKPIDEGDLRKAFCTPLIVDCNGKPLMLSVGAKAAYGHDPVTGKELWKVKHTCQAAAARPLFGHGLAFLLTGFGKNEMLAVRPDGMGDVSETHVVWRTPRGAPKMPSPLLVDDLIFMLNDNGALTCLDAVTGTEIWKERLDGEYVASPIYADGRIYCCNQDGKTSVVKAGHKFEILAKNVLDAGFMASPAASDGAFFLRTRTHLYRIEGGNGEPTSK